MLLAIDSKDKILTFISPLLTLDLLTHIFFLVFILIKRYTLKHAGLFLNDVLHSRCSCFDFHKKYITYFTCFLHRYLDSQKIPPYEVPPSETFWLVKLSQSFVIGLPLRVYVEMSCPLPYPRFRGRGRCKFWGSWCHLHRKKFVVVSSSHSL